MANHKDAIKRARQNEQRRARNRHYRTQMRSSVKAVRAAVDAGNVEDAQARLREAVSTIQRIASRGVIHRNQAARRIARLNAAVKGIATA